MIEINSFKLFAPWGRNEYERVVESNFAKEDDAKPYVKALKKIIAKQQLEPGNLHFYDIKFINGYEKEVKEVLQLNAEHQTERKAQIERVDVLAFWVSLVSGVVLIGMAYRYSKGKNQMFLFCASAIIPWVAYPHLKTYGRSYYPEKIVEVNRKEDAPFDLVLYRKQVDRKCPPNIQLGVDTNLFTQEELTEDDISTPRNIILPNAIVDAKKFVRNCLMKGEMRTLSNGEFTNAQYQDIMKQISEIFRISSGDFWKCIYDTYPVETDAEDYRGVDVEGKFTKEGKEKIQSSFSQAKDPALPEIDLFFDQLDAKIGLIVELLYVLPPFQQLFETFKRENGFNSKEIDALIPESMFPPFMIQIALNPDMEQGPDDEGGFLPYPVCLTPFISLIMGERYAPDWIKSQIQEAKRESIKKYKRMIRLSFLNMTGFSGEMRKEDRGHARIVRFEKLTGVSLLEN